MNLLQVWTSGSFPFRLPVCDVLGLKKVAVKVSLVCDCNLTRLSTRNLFALYCLVHFMCHVVQVVDEKQQQKNILKTSYELTSAALRKSFNVLRLVSIKTSLLSKPL